MNEPKIIKKGIFQIDIDHQVEISQEVHGKDRRCIMVDIDGTICAQDGDPKDPNDAYSFRNAKPFPRRIDFLNALHDDGHYITYWTARGCWNGIDHLDETIAQLNSWGVKYNDVRVFKPSYDIWIDDKAVGVSRNTEGAITQFQEDIERAIREI